MRGSGWTVSIVCCLVLNAALVEAAPASVPDKVRRDRQAEAAWIVRGKGPTGYMGYFAWVLDFSEARESPDRTLVLMFKGPCEVEKTKGGWSIGCSGRGFGKAVTASRFQMHPALDAASISVKHRGRRHRVGWTATQPVPGLYSYSEACLGLNEEGEEEEGSGEGGGIVKGAKAAGRILGRRLKPSSRFDLADLWSGATITECASPWQLRNLDLDDIRSRGSTRIHPEATLFVPGD
jgi:hypothetical protein